MGRRAEPGFDSSRRSAEPGFESSQRSAEHGFTLVELLVALSIFALLAAAGVMLLSGSVSAQGAVKTRLDDMAAVQRANAAIASDLGQAVPRVSRLENGFLAPAFYAQPRGEGAPILQFVRAGWSNLDAAPRSSLQKLEYWVRAGRLERRSFGYVDGAAGDAPATLLESVASVTLRFRDLAGQWHDAWMPTQPYDMPRAVELTLVRTGQPPLRLLFLVPPGPDLKPEAPVNG